MRRADGDFSVVLAGGGTGGHLYPLLSLADAIRRRVPAARFRFFATERGIDARLIRPSLVDGRDRFLIQSVRPLPRSAAGFPAFARGWWSSSRLCAREFAAERADVVIGSGGYGSVPAIRAGRRAGIPCVLLNPDAVPGKANRFLGPGVDRVFVQWPGTAGHFRGKARVVVAGCPIRSAFGAADRVGGVRRFGLDGSKRTLLVTGASQGARSINAGVVGALGRIGGIAGWQYLHLAGAADVERVRAAYASHALPAVVLGFTEWMADALAAADLVVSRGGASTLAEVTAMAVPSVILPYPHHRDRHQYANAAVLTEAHAAVLVEDRGASERTAERLGEVLGALMPCPERLSTMSRAAARVASPNAADDIAGAVSALAGFDGRGGGRSDSHPPATGGWRENGARDDDSRRADSFAGAEGAGGSVDAAA